MDIQNHFYGHSAAYAAHIGLDRPRHVAGLIQHGWTPNSPIRSHFADLARRTPEGGMFVWSHASRAWDEQTSREQTGFSSTAIGAPFLYLLDLVRRQGGLPERTLPTVVFPFHGTRLIHLEGDQGIYAREVYEKEGPAVVCLHVDDLQRPEIVRAWESAGHHLTTAGQRKDPRFLSRNLWLMASAEKVVSNRLATASFYAAAAGARTEIYGPFYSVKNAVATADEQALCETWPEFFEQNPDHDAVRALSERELGRDSLRSPEQLRRILGWDRRSPRAAWDYWAGAPVEKALNVLGVRKSAVEEKAEAATASPLHFLRHPLEHLPDRLPRTTHAEAIEPEIRWAR